MTKKKEEDLGSLKFGLGELFNGIGKLVDLIQQMDREGKSEIGQIKELKNLGEKGLRGVFGINIKTGLEGISRLDSFGNIRQDQGDLIIDEVQEPNVDLFQEDEYLQIIAEVPGVKESDIKIESKGNQLNISAISTIRQYRKEILLPFPAESKNISTGFNNGILEIKIKKS